jgi:hypothetical protein
LANTLPERFNIGGPKVLIQQGDAMPLITAFFDGSYDSLGVVNLRGMQ